MNDFDTSGHIWLRNAIDDATLAQLDQATASTRPGMRLGNSDLLDTVLGAGGPIAHALGAVMPYVFPTRVVAFDKSPAANWGVPWHQDRVIAVKEQTDLAGFSNWSNKDGIVHCEPPRAILDEMLFVRLHLDDEDMTGGPLEIALGSHKRGLVPAHEASNIATAHEIETCIGRRGDILVLKMLTLHRSSTATQATSRRVLRVDYANCVLPEPLEWGFCAA